jgi:chemotaxis signal transduction protein
MQIPSSRQNKGSKLTEQKQLFTFFVQDMLFGLDVEHVLMLDQNVDKIQPVPVEEQGFCGVIKLQGVVVPVLDFAHRLNVPSGLDNKKALIQDLKTRLQSHQQWVDTLADCLRNSETFNLDLEAAECASSFWLRQFESRDETLRELVRAISVPHHELHEAGVMATRQAQGQDPNNLAGVFRQQASQQLQKIKNLTHRACEQVQSDMRQVLLFVTEDGKTPRYALLIDEINDVISYDASNFQSSASGALAQFRKIGDVLAGIYTHEEQADCLYFDVNKLADNEALQTARV